MKSSKPLTGPIVPCTRWFSSSSYRGVSNDRVDLRSSRSLPGATREPSTRSWRRSQKYADLALPGNVTR